MPTYPTPGAGISTAGLDKLAGFKSPPDEGIDHFAGLTKDGLDTINNPVVSGVTETGLSSSGVTINWTTASPNEAGQVNYRTIGGATQIESETGSDITDHTVALTGLTPLTLYQYTIVQTSAEGGLTSVNGSFRTT